MYAKGEGTQKNGPKFIELMEKSAKGGYSLAQNEYGLILLNGLLGQGKFNEGVQWVKKAATQGLGEALVNLGVFSREGVDDWGNKVEPDYEKAFELFKQAAEKKSYNGMYNLAQFYQSGLSGEKNSAKAKELLDEILNSNSQNSYIFKALIYETGNGSSKDLQQAKHFYEICAESYGDIPARMGLVRVNEEIMKKAEEEKELEKKREFKKKLIKKEKTKHKKSSKSSKKSKKKAKKKTVDNTQPVIDQNEVVSLPLPNDVDSTDEMLKEEKPTPSSSTYRETILPEIQPEKQFDEASQEKDDDNSSVESDIESTDETIKEMLNNALSYDDQSIITEIDPQNNIVIIKNPYDDSVVTVITDQQEPLTPRKIKSLRKFTYDDRVKKWFGPEEEILVSFKENGIDRHRFAQRNEIDRHRFAQRVDEIIQLYGSKAIFVKPDGTLQENKILFGDITTKDKRTLKGTFEYAYYRDGSKLYHRFLHPSSKAVAVS